MRLLPDCLKPPELSWVMSPPGHRLELILQTLPARVGPWAVGQQAPGEGLLVQTGCRQPIGVAF